MNNTNSIKKIKGSFGVKRIPIQKIAVRRGLRIKKGFTLLEVLIVIGIIAILASISVVAINPSRQFKIARDTQRQSNVQTIANAVAQNMSENGGVFKCAGAVYTIPASSTVISSASGDVNIADCLMPKYLSIMPFDPLDGKYVTNSDYDTKYLIRTNSDSRIEVSTKNYEIASESIKAVR